MNQLIKEAIVLTASYYGLTMRQDVLAMYVEDLEDLPVNQVLEAYRAYRRDPLNKTNPLPAKIRSMINPIADSREQAQEIAQRCFGAIKKFGYTKPEQAKEYIGELGWRLIERRGGWNNHCSNTQESDIPILTAQFRESISSYINQGNISDNIYYNKVGLLSAKEILMIEQKPKENNEEKLLEKPQKIILEIKKPKKNQEEIFNLEKEKEEALARFKASFCN